MKNKKLIVALVWLLRPAGAYALFQAGQIAGDQSATVNTIAKFITPQGGTPIVGNSLLTDDGTSLKYNNVAIAGATGLAPATYKTATNCSSSAAPAVCASAAAGSVVVAAAGTTVVVNTTAVTANSQVFAQEDSSLSTKLSVTCNATPATAPPTVSARTAGTSFTITTTAPTTNPRCFSYWIIN